MSTDQEKPARPYAISMLAFHKTFAVTITRHRLTIRMAASEEEAVGIGMRLIQEMAPGGEGWSGYDVVVIPCIEFSTPPLEVPAA